MIDNFKTFFICIFFRCMSIQSIDYIHRILFCYFPERTIWISITPFLTNLAFTIFQSI